jgi:Kef-type K+ transport system membrane component KefB
MTLIAALSLLLAFAFALGRAAERFGQPALLGQMLAGVVLGPSLLGWIRATPELAAVADLSVLFVVVAAGLEMRMRHVLETFRGRGSFALLLGCLIPAAAAAVLAWLLALTLVPATVVTLCVSVTALPVALRILSGFGLLNTRVARVAISGALLSDVLVLLALGVTIAIATPLANAGLPSTLSLAVVKLGGLLAVVGVCYFISLRLPSSSIWQRWQSAWASVDAVLVLTLLFVLGLGAVAELLGFHFVIGAFLAALMVTRGSIGDARFDGIQRTCDLMTASLFGPLFLAYQGVQFELGTLGNWSFLAGLIAVAVSSKLVGGYAAARLSSLPQHEALGVAVIMNARGVMEMVVASIAYRAGLVDATLFSALLVMGIITTMLTPLMLKRWMASPSFAAGGGNGPGSQE